MDNMDLQTFAGLAFRHAATTVGGWLVANGYLQTDGLQGFVGAAMILGGIALSFWQKKGQAALVAELASLKAKASGSAPIKAAMDQKTGAK